jgi:hypothetical protein
MSLWHRCSTKMLAGFAGGLLIVSVAGATPTRPIGQAIQFGISWIFTLDRFQDATLAYQRSISPDVAWRTSVGIELDYEDGEYSLEYQARDSVDVARDQLEWAHAVSVASEWLWYRGDNVSVFFGGGPRLSYSTSQDDYWRYSIEDTEWTRDRTQRREFGGGAQGCLGVQWVAVEWLTIHAEYAARAIYFHRVSENKREDETSTRTETTIVDGLMFDSLGVRFGLSVYF